MNNPVPTAGPIPKDDVGQLIAAYIAGDISDYHLGLAISIRTESDQASALRLVELVRRRAYERARYN